MADRVNLNPSGAVPVRLTDRERHLILNETMAPGALVNRLRIVIVCEGGAEAFYTLDELDDLLDYVGTAAQETEQAGLQDELTHLYDKIDDILDLHMDQAGEFLDDDDEFPDLLKQLPVDLLETLKDHLSDREFSSFDEMSGQVDKIITAYNDRPREEMGGLSPSQVLEIAEADWDNEQGAIRINTGLTASDLAGVPIFANARMFLSAILESGPVKATKNKNLTRKFVERMLEVMVLPEGFMEMYRKYVKAANEIEVQPLNVLRIVAQLSKLIQCRNGKFQVTKKGKTLLADEHAGALYACLFKSFYREFNLAYLDRHDELDGLQAFIPYSLYVIAQRGNEWLSPEAFAELVLLPAAKDEIDATERDLRYEWPVLSRIINPLTQQFGLLERETPSVEYPQFLESPVRKTPLFDRFIRFHLSET